MVLIRHGQTDYSSQGRYQGWTNTRLNQKGRQQAKRIATALQAHLPEKIYSSTLARAKETTLTVAKQYDVPFRWEENLKELYFGQWEGKTWQEIKNTHPQARDKFEARNFCPPGGESILTLQQRVLEFWEKAVKEDKDILLVTHSGPIKLILLNAVKASLGGFWHLRVDLGSISLLETAKGKPVVTKVNDTSHLDSKLKGL